MTDHSTNGHGGQTLHSLEARHARRSFEAQASRLGPAWDYDGRGPVLCGTFRLGDGAICSERCLIELAGCRAPEREIHPHLEVCDRKLTVTLTPDLGSDGELSLTALRFAVEFDGLVEAGLGG